jgi:DNA-binding NarL/FixJ family response regulator
MFIVQERIHADPVSRHETLDDALAAVAELTEHEGADAIAFAIREVDPRGNTLRVIPLGTERPEHALTPRERQVLILMSEGLTNQQIADRLEITRTTVRVHVRHILDKLGRSRRSAERHAEARR